MPLDLCRIPQGTALKKSSKFSKFEPQNASPTIIKKNLKKVTKDDKKSAKDNITEGHLAGK